MSLLDSLFQLIGLSVYGGVDLYLFVTFVD